MKSNNHKKLFSEDKFGRRYYCKHARMGLVRTEKKLGKKAWRRNEKEMIKEYEN